MKYFPQPQSTHCSLEAVRIACFGKETHTHRGRDPRPAHRARQDSTLFSLEANDPLDHHSDRSPSANVKYWASPNVMISEE